MRVGDVEIPTPESDRMLAHKDEAQAIGEFLEWLLHRQGVELMTWKSDPKMVPCTRWHDTRSARARTEAVNDLLEVRAELAGADPSTVVGLPDPSTSPHPADCDCEGTGQVVSYDEGLVPWHPEDNMAGGLIERIIAWYLLIDLAEADREKREILRALQKLNEADVKAGV